MKKPLIRLTLEGREAVMQILREHHRFYSLHPSRVTLDSIKHRCALAELDAEEHGMGWVTIDFVDLVHKYPPRWTDRDKRAFVLGVEFFTRIK